MQFINEESYNIIYKYNKLNQKINIDTLEISNLEKKKRGNETILDIQENVFYTIIEQKCEILKKYKFQIIKNAINYNKNKQIINLIYKLINNNQNELSLLHNTKIYKYNNEFYSNKINLEYNKLILLNKFKHNNNDKLYNLFYNYIKKDCIINNNSTKEDLCKIYIKNKIINIFSKKDIKNININFILYIYNNHIGNNYNIYDLLLFIYNINIYKYKLKNIHNNLKEYFKNKKLFEKLKNSNTKLYKDVKKTYKKNDFIIKKSNQILIKYKYNEKIINNQFIKYNKIKNDYKKNIIDININIGYLKEILIINNEKLLKIENLLNNFNKIFGKKYNINDTCSICLNDLDYSVKTKCNHHFHYNCILLYICNILNDETNINIICPICRQYI